MYIWRETKGRSGWDDAMVQYRNAMVKEINFVLSPSYASVNTSSAAARDYELFKKTRIQHAERIKDPVRKRQIELSLIEEPLNYTHDTATAEIFIKYFKLKHEHYGSGLYYALHQPGSAYHKIIEKREFEKAIEFLDFFPEDDAQKEFIYLFSVAAEDKLTRVVLFLLELLKGKEFRELQKNSDIQSLLKEEYKRAEEEKRIEDAAAIVALIDDKEVRFRMKAMEALLERDTLTSVEYLQKISDKSSLKNLIIDAYWNEYHAAAKEPERYRNAFLLAQNGGLTEGDYREYIEHPAEKIIEGLFSDSEMNNDRLDQADEYIPYLPEETLRDISARLFMRMIKENNTKRARIVKKRLNVRFDHGPYKSESDVMEFYARLTATKGDMDTPKGHENLEAALDVAELFDLDSEEVTRIRTLLFKHFIREKDFTRIKHYYNPHDRDILEFIDQECQRLIEHKQVGDAFTLIRKLNVKFPDDITKKRKAYLGELIRASALAREDFSKGVAFEQLYGLDVIPDYFYRRFIENCFESMHIGTQSLIDLNQFLIPHMSSCLRIQLQGRIEEMHDSNSGLASELEKAYRSILPPTFFNRVICVLLRMFGLE